MNGEEAARWYRAAAEQGHIKAMYRLSELYRSGELVPMDRKESVRWFMRAMRAQKEQESEA